MKRKVLKRAMSMFIALILATSIVASTFNANAAIRVNERFSSYVCTYTAFDYNPYDYSEHIFYLTYTQKSDFLRAVDRVVSAIKNNERHIEFTDYNISINDMDSLATYIVQNYPELFYFAGFTNIVNIAEDFEGSFNPYIDPVISFDIDYISNYSISDSEIENMQVKIDRQTNIILAAVKDKDLSDFDKILYLNTYLAEMLDYSNNDVNCINIYGALVECKVNCQGYAYTMKYFLDKLGIENYIALSKKHVWNVIKVDGEFYNLDLTWTHNYYNQTYFLKNDVNYAETHGDWVISAPYNIVGQNENIENNIKCTSETYKNGMSTSAVKSYWQKTLAPKLNTTYILSNMKNSSRFRFLMPSLTNKNTYFLQTGDVNFDGAVTIDDATTIQNYLVGLAELDEIQISVADVDGDGTVSIMDVTSIQKYLADYFSKFPIDQNTHFDFDSLKYIE